MKVKYKTTICKQKISAKADPEGRSSRARRRTTVQMINSTLLEMQAG
jgi:hypothetical protein